MTRLAFDLDDWSDQPFTGTAVLTPGPDRQRGGHVRERPAVGLRARCRTTPRPAPDRAQVLRLHRRRHRPLRDRRRPAPGHAVRPRARPRAEPERDRLGQPADHLHPRHRRSRWCRSTRSAARASRDLLIGNLPPVSVDGAPTDHPAPDLLRRAAVVVRRRPAPSRTSSTTRPATPTPAARSATQTRWTGTTGIKLDTTLMRLLFAAAVPGPRPADQRPGHRDSQLLFHRSPGRPAGDDRAVPALRQGPVPRHRRRRPAGLRAGRLHDLRPVPERPGVRPDDAGRPRAWAATTFNYIRNSVKITMDAYDGTMHFYVADPDDPIIRAYEGVFPTLFEPLSRDAGRPRAPTCACPRSCSTSRPAMFGRYHVTDPHQFFRNGRPVDRADGHDERADPAVRGVLRRDAPAGRDRRRVPPPPADGPDQPAEHDRVGRGADGRRRTTGRRWSTGSRPTRRSSGPAQIEARIDQDPIISAQISLWNQSGSKVIRGNLIVRAARRRPDLPPTDLSPVDRLGVPGVHADRRRVAAPGRLERDPGRCAPSPAGGRGRRPAATRRRRRRPARARAPRPTPGSGRQPDADAGGRAADRRAGPHRLRRTPTSSSPSRRSATVTSPATARRSRWSRPPSSGSRSSPRVSRSRAWARRPAPRREPGSGAHRRAARDAGHAGHLAAGARRRSCSAAGSSWSSCRSSCCRRRSGSPTSFGPAVTAIALGSVTRPR